MSAIAIVVYWCVATAPFDSFNPHQIDAVEKFIQANPDTCHAAQAEEIDPGFGPASVEECRRGALMNFMPGWLAKNPGKVYLTADCFLRRPEPLDLEALKRQVAP